jgi:PrcB C-terminal
MSRVAALALLLAATPVAFTEVRDPREWPPAVQQWVQAHRELGGTGVAHDGAHTYLLAAAGMYRTGGYRLGFSEVTEADGRIVAVAVLSSPPPGGAVTMAITYPLAVVRMARTPLPIEIRRS